ncbi:MAG: penicillin-binding protein, partial [Deltaproteobacteria bacterium]|nr:penicillin-binding protein [Deltaproteobacteria bacterium]
MRHLSPGEIGTFRKEQEEKFRSTPPTVGDIVEGLVEKVDDANKQVIVSLGKEKGVISIADMKWARKPDPEVPYYAAKLEKPSDALS